MITFRLYFIDYAHSAMFIQYAVLSNPSEMIIPLKLSTTTTKTATATTATAKQTSINYGECLRNGVNKQSIRSQQSFFK